MIALEKYGFILPIFFFIFSSFKKYKVLVEMISGNKIKILRYDKEENMLQMNLKNTVAKKLSNNNSQWHIVHNRIKRGYLFHFLKE